MEIELLNANEAIIERASARAAKAWLGINDELYGRVKDLLARFPTQNRKFVQDDSARKLLTELRAQLQRLLPKASADEFMQEVLVDFDGLAENIRAVHSEENDVFVPKQLVNSQKAFMVDNLASGLFQAGYDARFADPVVKVLYTHINTGATVVEAEQAMRALVYGVEGSSGLMTRYAGQVARDSLNQFQGSVHKAVMDKYELKHLRYVGGLVKDSRWQCRRWVAMEWLKIADLKSEIRRARNRGGGMIPGTTPSNFVIFKGGYNCLHTAFPSRGPL